MNLDSLIGHLQLIRARHGNMPVAPFDYTGWEGGQEFGGFVVNEKKELEVSGMWQSEKDALSNHLDKYIADSKKLPNPWERIVCKNTGF